MNERIIIQTPCVIASEFGGFRGRKFPIGNFIVGFEILKTRVKGSASGELHWHVAKKHLLRFAERLRSLKSSTADTTP